MPDWGTVSGAKLGAGEWDQIGDRGNGARLGGRGARVRLGAGGGGLDWGQKEQWSDWGAGGMRARLEGMKSRGPEWRDRGSRSQIGE